MEIEQLELKNGLKTLFVHSPGATAASVQFWFRAGSALEKDNDLGIAHFLEHMFFKGTQKRPDGKIAFDVDSFGGEINAFTSFDYTCYYINTPINHLPETVDILMDMVANPEFKENDLIPEREVVFEEYRQMLDSPGQYNFSAIQKLSFNEGYKHPILGYDKTIKKFSTKQLKNFRTRYYNLQNSMLIVAGDLDQKEKLINEIESFTFPNGDHSSFPEFKITSKNSFHIHKKDVSQALITFVIQAPDYTEPSAAAEDLAINSLCFGNTSLLYKNLVLNKSMANAVSGSTMFFSKGGAHFIKISCPAKNIPLALNEFLKTIQEGVENGLPEEDVQKVLNQYIASKVYEKESLEAFAFNLGHGFAQNGDIYSEDKFIEQVKALDVSTVNKAIKTIFNKKINIEVQIPSDFDEDLIEKNIKKFYKFYDKKKTLSIKSKYKKTTSKYDSEANVYQLKNGIKLIHRKNDLTPTFNFHAYIKGGLAFEKENNNGSYYLISKLLTSGYPKWSYEKLSRDLQNMSASFNGFAGKNAYGLTLHGQTKDFKKLIEHFSNSLINPSFPTKILNHEKKIIKRIFDTQKKDPIKVCFKEFSKIIFPNHHYQLNTIGNEKSLKNLKQDFLLQTHQKRLKNSPLLFTYCGNLEADSVIEVIEECFSKLKARTDTATIIKKNTGIKVTDKHIDFDREQVQIFIGKPAVELKSKKDIYFQMLSTLLSGQSSALFTLVRDQLGLCYAVQAVHFSALEAGYWGVYIAAGKEKAHEAILVIKELLREYGDKGISKEDFNRVKEMIQGQNLLNLQTNNDFANTYSIPVLHGMSIDFHYQRQNEIMEAKWEDFNNFLKTFLNGSWNTVSVGRMEN